MKDDYEGARKTLDLAIELNPDFQPAKELLEEIEMIASLRSGWGRWQAEQQKRNDSKRARQRTLLTTRDPSLDEALSIYTKEAMTDMARAVPSWGGWSALKKAALHHYLVEHLQEEDTLSRLAAALTNEDKKALRRVLELGGRILWNEFDTEFGNDYEDSPYWQYHDPETVMGRLRVRGRLVETTVGDQLYLTMPVELRRPLALLI